MVASTGAPSIAVAQPSNQATLVDSPPATNAGVAAYIASGERVRTLMDLAWRLCLGLALLVALAWVFGALPGAVKLF
jgi:hypothetical protein